MVDAQPAAGYAGDLTPTQAMQLLREHPQAALVDVRTSAEVTYVGRPDLSELGRPQLHVEWVSQQGQPNPRFVDEVRQQVPSDAPVVFLCRSGVRSVAAAKAATNAGMGPAYNVTQGFEGDLDSYGHRGAAGWRAEGLPWRQS
jgi:rhodanese-related sulfurtransferase